MKLLIICKPKSIRKAAACLIKMGVFSLAGVPVFYYLGSVAVTPTQLTPEHLSVRGDIMLNE